MSYCVYPFVFHLGFWLFGILKSIFPTVPCPPSSTFSSIPMHQLTPNARPPHVSSISNTYPDNFFMHPFRHARKFSLVLLTTKSLFRKTRQGERFSSFVDSTLGLLPLIAATPPISSPPQRTIHTLSPIPTPFRLLSKHFFHGVLALYHSNPTKRIRNCSCQYVIL